MNPTGKVILVIDDDDSIRSLLSTHLRQSGHRPETAASGGEGLAKARKLKPDLILLDVALPDISGLETLQMLKADRDLSAIPVVILSCYPLHQGSSVFLEAGAADFLTKRAKLTEVISRSLSFIPGPNND